MNENREQLYQSLRNWIDRLTLGQAQEFITGATQTMAVQLLTNYTVQVNPASSGGGGGGTGPHLTVKVVPPPPPPPVAELSGVEGTLALLQVALNLKQI